MITKLCLENFRAFKNATIDLRKINLFLGPNNSGKSSLISALTLVSQTIKSADIDADILLSGRFEDFGSYFDMVHGNEESEKIKIGIEADLILPGTFFVPSKRGGRLLRFREERQRGYLEITLGYRKRRHEVQLIGTEFRMPEENLMLRTRRNTRGRHVVDSMEGLEDVDPSRIDQLLSVRNLLPQVYPVKILRLSTDSYAKLRKMQRFITGLRQQLNQIEFIGPFRTNPQRIYVLTGESPTNVGRHGDRAWEVLIQDEKKKGKEKKNLLKMVSEWMKKAEMAKGLYAESITDRYFQIGIKNYHTGEIENLVDVGFGCSQIIPVLIAGFNVGKDGIFIVEEPEINLHPRAQAELGSVFYEMNKRGVQLIIETHNEHLLLRMQSHVAHGDINTEDVNVFYIDPTGKEKAIKRLPLGKDGFFTEEWPRGFFPERLAEAKRLAKYSL